MSLHPQLKSHGINISHKGRKHAFLAQSLTYKADTSFVPLIGLFLLRILFGVELRFLCSAEIRLIFHREMFHLRIHDVQ